MEAHLLAKDTQAEWDREKKAFQAEKEGFLRDLEQARAGEVDAKRKIAELEDQAREEIYMFKLVKYEQGYRDWAQEKPSRYPLEVDVAKGDQVDFMPSVFVVSPPHAAPEMIAELPGILSLMGLS